MSIYKRIARSSLNLINPKSSRFMTFPRFLGSYTKTLRSHLCGDLRPEHIGQPVQLCGWLHKKRMDKFLILRDWTGLVQVVVDEAGQEKWEKLVETIPLESVIRVRGVPQNRPAGQENSAMPTGLVEVLAEDIELVNAVQNSLPFSSLDRKVNETIRLYHRYLDFRTSRMQSNLRLRSSVTMKMRQFLHDQNGFVDVETPYLFRRTPGGAREFLVPSQQPGKFYSLAQSPQQFKQLLMVGGFDRYFQIARCFRDETNNPEKQPEFTQLDLEMSFVDEVGIQTLIEDLLVDSWPVEKLGAAPQTPFPRMAYRDAMDLYGSDKPDTRFGLTLRDLTEFCRGNELFTVRLEDGTRSVKAFVAPKGVRCCKAAFQRQMQDLVRKEHPGVTMAFIRVDENGAISNTSLKEDVQAEMLRVLEAGAEDMAVICIGKGDRGLKALGRMRLEFAAHLEKCNQAIMPKGNPFNFLWVVDFPLFEASDDPKTPWTSAHHPFTAPAPADAHLLNTTNLGSIRGQHYDLVLNGSEVGGGSIRIHNGATQRQVLSLLNIDPTELNHLLTALESGCPPHGGIALGLDRLISMYAGAKSIRDVIAFPKTAAGNDLMGSAPCRVPQEQLDFYHISPRRGPAKVVVKDSCEEVLPKNEETDPDVVVVEVEEKQAAKQ